MSDEPTELDPKQFLIEGGATYSGYLINNLDHPTFPFTITIGGTSVTLLADGKWEGDIVEFKRAIAGMKGHLGNAGLLVWVLLREMIRDDERFW